jgi:hypothetical protein
MSYTLQPITANTAFGPKKRYSSNDYLSYIKSKRNVCDFKKQCLRLAGRGKFGWSAQVYTDFNKVKNNNVFFDFSQLYAGLYTTLDFKSNDINNNPIEIIKNNISGNSPTTIIPKNKMCMPPYEVYTIDPNGSLFGRTPCGYLNYMNFIRPKLQSKPCHNNVKPTPSRPCTPPVTPDTCSVISENDTTCYDNTLITRWTDPDCEYNSHFNKLDDNHKLYNDNNQCWDHHNNDYTTDDWFTHIFNPGFENYVKDYEKKREEEKKKGEIIKEEIIKEEIIKEEIIDEEESTSTKIMSKIRKMYPFWQMNELNNNNKSTIIIK